MTDPLTTSFAKITETIKGGYPSLDATILAMDAPPAFDAAAELTRKHGTIVLLGSPEKGIGLSYNTVIYRDIKLVRSPVAARDEAEELVDLVEKRGIQVKFKKWRREDAEKMR